MIPPPCCSSCGSARRSWSPQSQRREPNTSPVRQAECKRTETGCARSGCPTMTAIGVPPTASRKTTNRAGIPPLSGIAVSATTASDAIAVRRNCATASAATSTSGGLFASTAAVLASATSSAGSSWASLASSIAAGAVSPTATTSRWRAASGRADGIEPERASAARGHEKMRPPRRAQQPKSSKPLVAHAVDRQGHDPLAGRRYDDRPPRAKFGKTTLYCDLLGRPKQTRRSTPSHFIHTRLWVAPTAKPHRPEKNAARRILFRWGRLFRCTRLQSPSREISWHDATGSESRYLIMAHGRPARPNRSEPGGRENGSDAALSWAPVPKTFRAGDGSLPQPWEDIFGPLRKGAIDDLVLVGQCGQSIDARVATLTGH